jgi:hypothetical protein
MVVEWLRLLLCIQEVPGSISAMVTSHPEVFVVFLSHIQAKARIVP